MPNYDRLEKMDISELKEELRHHNHASNRGKAVLSELDRRLTEESLRVARQTYDQGQLNFDLTDDIRKQTNKVLLWARIPGIAAILAIVVTIIIAVATD